MYALALYNTMYIITRRVVMWFRIRILIFTEWFAKKKKKKFQYRKRITRINVGTLLNIIQRINSMFEKSYFIIGQ